jgi:hypothetical protein
MKTRLSQLIFLTASVIAIASLTVTAGPPKGAGKGKDKERRIQALANFDAYKDGKLSESERLTAFRTRLAKEPKLTKRLLGKFDANKDGQLSDDEMKDARNRDGRRGPRKVLKRGQQDGQKGKGKRTSKKKVF